MPCCKRCAAHVAGQQRNGPACAPIEAAAGRFRVFHSSEKNSRARAICLCTQSRVRSPGPPFVYISVQAPQPVHRTSLLLMSCLRPMQQWCGALDACKCCILCHDVATVLQALSAAACAGHLSAAHAMIAPHSLPEHDTSRRGARSTRVPTSSFAAASIAHLND
jgi:hypothetical protein